MPEPLPTLVREKLLDLPEGLEIWRVSPTLLKEQDKNARVQSPEIFRALVRNIAKRGALESLPFCARDGETFSIISGHHRVRAAIQAELRTVVVLVDPLARTRAAVVAKQVAHNSINGVDEPSVLLQILAEIDEVEALLESAVDKAALEVLSKAPITVPDIKVDYAWKIVTFTFLPTQVAHLDLLTDLLSTSDVVRAVPEGLFTAFTEAMRRLGRTEDVRSIGAQVYRMLEITRAHLDAVDAARAAAAPPVQP